MAMSNGVTGGIFATLADLQASKPRVNTRVELVTGERYSIDLTDKGNGVAVSGLFANRVYDSDNDTKSRGLYKVSPDKVLLSPEGEEFKIFGTQIFTYNFIKFEYRDDYRYRVNQGIVTLADGSTVTPGVDSGVSEPTFNASVRWIDRANVRTLLESAFNFGCNFVQIGVEPAMQFVPSYIDPSDGLTYPSEMEMLDICIEEANNLGMVVCLRQDNDQVTVAHNVTFLSFLADRYADNNKVWINPRNEINCAPILQSGGGSIANPNCTVPSVWKSDQEAYVTAIRSSGLNKNPIIINPTDYGRDLAQVDPEIQSSAVLGNDENLIIGTHIYQNLGDSDFFATELASTESDWKTGLEGKYNIFIDEVGLTNDGQNYDPNTGSPSVDLVEFQRKKGWLTGFCKWWASKTATNRTVSGCMALAWNATFGSGAGLYYDFNNMFYLQTTGLLSDWGQIYIDNFVNRNATKITTVGTDLTLTGGTDLLLSPKLGSEIMIANKMVSIPTTGVALAGINPIPRDTVHWVYVFENAGEIEMEISTDSPVNNAIDGYLCKTGEEDKTLVGAVYFKTGIGITNTGNRKFFRSLYNEPDFSVVGELTSNAAVTSAVFSSVSSELELEFIAFPDERFDIGSTLNYQSSVSELSEFALGINGANKETTVKNFVGTINQPIYLSPSINEPSVTGYNTASLSARSATATITALDNSKVVGKKS